MKTHLLDSIVFVGLGSMNETHLREVLARRLQNAKLPPCVIIIPEGPPQLTPEKMMELSRAFEAPEPFFPRQTRRDRSHPNEPFYRKLQRRRSRRHSSF
jgi:hypothetical protein